MDGWIIDESFEVKIEGTGIYTIKFNIQTQTSGETGSMARDFFQQ